VKRASGPVPFIVHFIDLQGRRHTERVVATRPDAAKLDIARRFDSPLFLKVKVDRKGEGG